MSKEFEAIYTEPIGTKDAFEKATQGRQIHKYSNYFQIYDRYLAPFRGKNPKILEIGVQHGGSLLMWDAYFGGRETVVGIDILPECKKFERDKIKVFIGDQSDETFLKKVIDQVGKFDIIVDDGSHIPRHQIASFQYLFYNGLADHGVYICEDCHTNYWPRYGGGLRKSGTFIEFSKRLADDINAWHAAHADLKPTEATKWIRSISFYSSVVVFEKEPVEHPEAVVAGTEGIDLDASFKANKYARFILPLKKSQTLQRLVRTNPALWNLMRSFLTSRN